MSTQIDYARQAAQSLARTKEQWLSIFETQTNGSPEAIADRVLRDMWGYNNRTGPRGAGRVNSRYFLQDTLSLAAALEAYHERMTAAGSP